MKEIWKDIPNYEGFYKCSNLGRIKRLETHFIRKDGHPFSTPERILNPHISRQPRNGYRIVTLTKNDVGYDIPVHKIVAICFLPKEPFPKAEINHKNYVKTDNRSDNLEWTSHLENMRHARQMNPILRKHQNNFGKRTMKMNRKLTPKQVKKIRSMFHLMIDREIASIFNVNRKTISHIRHKITWKN